MNKTCSKCNQTFPATIEHFKPRKDSKDGLRGQCIECESKRRKDYTKRTSKQNVARIKQWRLDNPNRYKEQSINYYETNKDKWKISHRKRYSIKKEEILSYQEEYRSKHKKAIRNYFKQYREQNQKVLKIRRKKYYEQNKDKVLIDSHKRDASKKELPNHLTLKQWKKCKEHFNFECAYCGKSVDKPHQEHFVPLSKGGEYTVQNIIPACKSCNSSKRDRNFFEWYIEQDYYSKKREQKILNYLGYTNNIQQLSIL